MRSMRDITVRPLTTIYSDVSGDTEKLEGTLDLRLFSAGDLDIARRTTHPPQLGRSSQAARGLVGIAGGGVGRVCLGIVAQCRIEMALRRSQLAARLARHRHPRAARILRSRGIKFPAEVLGRLQVALGDAHADCRRQE